MSMGPVVTGHLLLLKVSTDEIVTRGNPASQEFREEIVITDWIG